MVIIGIDCATRPKNTGLARGHYYNGVVTIDGVMPGSENALVDTITTWIEDPTLLTFDAPLGWPVELAGTLIDHRAGEDLKVEADMMFQRQTDREVRKWLGKRPLEVGAARIARTARAALRLLAAIRNATGRRIPLLWDHTAEEPIGAIEVYPAGTLRAHGFRNRSYKRSGEFESRRALLEEITASGKIDLQGRQEGAVESDHLVDALICVLAGMDFLEGQCIPPTDYSLARKEGWIWVRKPQ